MTLPPKLLAVLAFYERWLERAAPRRIRELISIGRDLHAELERELRQLRPRRFTTTPTAEVMVQVRTLLEATAVKYGEQMGAALETIFVAGAKRGRESLEKQLEAWRAEGLLPPEPLGPPPAQDAASRASPPLVTGSVSSPRTLVRADLATEVLDPGLLEMKEASIKAYGEEMIAKMRRSLARGVLANETIAQTTERMAAEFDMPAWRAERIVRTEQSFAFHRRQILDLIDRWGDEAETLWRKQLLAVMDDRTGEDSKFVDGQVRKLLELFEDNEGRRYQHPPNRPNDREKMVFVPIRAEAPEQAAEPSRLQLTTPSLPPDPRRNPRGSKSAAHPADEDAQVSTQRENEAAKRLAEEGYDVEQNPGDNGTGHFPDYRIDGEYFDCYAPTTARPRSVWTTISGKIKKPQARRFVINLADYQGSKDELAKQFKDWPLDGLEQVLIIDKDGTVSQIFP